MAKQTGIMGKIISLVFAIYIIAYAVSASILALTNSTVYVPATQATGTYQFGTGNVSNGELVNITNGASIYNFEFNITNNGSVIICKTANCIPVNLSGVNNSGATPNLYNQSWLASGNLTAAINNNASASAIVTAVNTTNRTSLTAINTGVVGNVIQLSTNAAKITAAGMSGAANGYGFATNDPNAVIISTLISIIVVIGIAWMVYRHLQVK